MQGESTFHFVPTSAARTRPLVLTQTSGVSSGSAQERFYRYKERSRWERKILHNIDTQAKGYSVSE